MSMNQYREEIKSLIDATNDEALLAHWKKRLQYDMENREAVELSEEEWTLVEEGMTDYKNGKVVSLEEFISKRK